MLRDQDETGIPFVDLPDSGIQGLNEAEAAEKLKLEGYNEIASPDTGGLRAILLDILREPMFLLLLATTLLYSLLGSWSDSLGLILALGGIVIITVYQKRRTERVLEKLRDLSSPLVLVLRGGVEKYISSKYLVSDDIIVLKEGDRVPADAFITDTQHITVNESVITGESVPVNKKPQKHSEDNSEPNAKNSTIVYSGTLVVSGWAYARIYATGNRTELGKIGSSLKEIQEEDTHLNKEIKRIIRVAAVLGLSICFLILFIYGFSYGEWLKGVLAGLTLAMAVLPEEFPVVMTVFLALGAWRIAQKHVLARNNEAIETLGAATVLCTDKTGTITLNTMRVEKLYANGKEWNVQETDWSGAHEVVEFAVLASHKNPFDPMEKAIMALGKNYVHGDWELLKEYPLTSELLCMSEVWQPDASERRVVAAKGAPEAVFDLCHLAQSQRNELEKVTQGMAEQGLRVLGVAKATFTGGQLPMYQRDFDFTFAGLIGLADPVRPAVAQSIKECHTAGIRVIMITGDYPATAQHIATEIGLTNPESILSGDELEKMTDEELKDKVGQISVFARIVPIQKLRIVQALKAKEEVVAMTGDGVNDAPALKAAHIGIAMGKKGTDVAREAADLVLLNDNFNSIVDAIRMGRRIFSNLQKSMSYIVAIHIPIAGLSLIPVFAAGWPIVLLPIHIAFIELVTDPVLSIAFEAEPEEKNTMYRPPRRLGEPLFGRKRIWLSLLQGAGVLASLVVVYFILMAKGYSEADIRTITFCTLIVGNFGLVLVNRSWTRFVFSRHGRRNKSLYYILAGIVIFFLLVLYVPAFREIFHFSTLHPDDLLIGIIAGIAGISWFELVKLFSRIRQKTKLDLPLKREKF